MSYLDNCKIRILNINGKDMPDSEYFALKGYTSVSRLKLLDPWHNGSPEKYLQGFDFGYNESLILGTVVHSQILQPDDFILSDYDKKPAGKLGLFVELVHEYRQKGMTIQASIDKASEKADYYSGKLTRNILRKAMQKGLPYYFHLVKEGNKKDGKEVYYLSKNLLDSAHQCIRSVNNNSVIQELLSENMFEDKQFFNEIALFSDIEVEFPDHSKHIIKFKGKLDSVIWDPEKKILYLNDVKTTSKQLEYFMDQIYNESVCEGVFSYRAYYMQLAAYGILLQKYFQEILHITDYTLKYNIFAVETMNEHRSDVFHINNSYNELGISKFKELICRLAYHEVNGFDKNFPE